GLEEGKAVVLRAGGVVEPEQAAAQVPRERVGSSRPVLRRVDERGPGRRGIRKLCHEQRHDWRLPSRWWPPGAAAFTHGAGISTCTTPSTPSLRTLLGHLNGYFRDAWHKREQPCTRPDCVCRELVAATIGRCSCHYLPRRPAPVPPAHRRHARLRLAVPRKR